MNVASNGSICSSSMKNYRIGVNCPLYFGSAEVTQCTTVIYEVDFAGGLVAAATFYLTGADAAALMVVTRLKG